MSVSVQLHCPAPPALEKSAAACTHAGRLQYMYEIRIFSVEDRMFESMKVDVFSVKIEYFILNLE